MWNNLLQGIILVQYETLHQNNLVRFVTYKENFKKSLNILMKVAKKYKWNKISLYSGYNTNASW